MRVGLVGCGRWGRHVLRDLLALECDVPVVARSAASVARAREAGAEEIVGDVRALERLDGVVVATPTTTHAEVVERSLELGVPVFCEKPLCVDAADARRLAGLAPDRLFVMDKWRYHPGVAALARIAHEGSLGAVRGLRTTRVGWGNPHDDVDAVWILAPHDLSIALEVLGALPPARAAHADAEDGVPVSLVGLTADDRVWHVLEVSARSPARTRRVELQCDGGVAVLAGGWNDHVTVYRDRGDVEPAEERVETLGELPLLAELRAFVRHLDGAPAPRSSAAEGALVVERLSELRELAGVS